MWVHSSAGRAKQIESFGPNADTWGPARWTDNESAYIFAPTAVDDVGAVCHLDLASTVHTDKLDIRFEYRTIAPVRATSSLSLTLLDVERARGCSDYTNPVEQPPGVTLTLQTRPSDVAQNDVEFTTQLNYDQPSGRLAQFTTYAEFRYLACRHLAVDGPYIRVWLDDQAVLEHRFDRPLTMLQLTQPSIYFALGRTMRHVSSHTQYRDYDLSADDNGR